MALQGAAVSARKDCVHLKPLVDVVVTVNSFLPERADTGRNG